MLLTKLHISATLFDVTIKKTSRGLGLALTGGVECESCLLPGLIRIRKLYPQTPAWICGRLQVNDFILEANGKQLTGLTSHVICNYFLFKYLQYI